MSTFWLKKFLLTDTHSSKQLFRCLVSLCWNLLRIPFGSFNNILENFDNICFLSKKLCSNVSLKRTNTSRLRGWSCQASWSASWRARRRSWWGRCPSRRRRRRWAGGASKWTRQGRATILGVIDRSTFGWTALLRISTMRSKGWRWQWLLTRMYRTAASRLAAGRNILEYLQILWNIFANILKYFQIS